MKKIFKYYMIAWALLFIAFNAISYLVPGWPTLEKTSLSFWIGFALINIAFIGHLICACMAFKGKTTKNAFYNISLWKVSCAGLIINFVIGLICMIVSPLPYWVGTIVCFIVLVLHILAVIKAKLAVELVTAVDEKTGQTTAFIYDMRSESESLLTSAKTDDVKALCKKVRDAFKFSDPMSNDALASVEEQIAVQFRTFGEAVRADDAELTQATIKELLALISERNNKCKRLK